MPSIFVLISHLGQIMSFVKAIENWVALAVKIKNVPNASDSKALLDQVRALLDAKIIDVPGVDEAQISVTLKKIEDAICPPQANP